MAEKNLKSKKEKNIAIADLEDYEQEEEEDHDNEDEPPMKEKVEKVEKAEKVVEKLEKSKDHEEKVEEKKNDNKEEEKKVISAMEKLKITEDDERKQMKLRMIAIKNIPPETLLPDLYNLFSNYGITNIHVFKPFDDGQQNNAKVGNNGTIIFKTANELQKFLKDKKEYRLGMYKLQFELENGKFEIPKNRTISIGIFPPNIEDEEIIKWTIKKFGKLGKINGEPRITMDVHANKFAVVEFVCYLDYIDIMSYCRAIVVEFDLVDGSTKELKVIPYSKQEQRPPYRPRGRGRGFFRGVQRGRGRGRGRGFGTGRGYFANRERGFGSKPSQDNEEIS
jgi:hypothetical protein